MSGEEKGGLLLAYGMGDAESYVGVLGEETRVMKTVVCALSFLEPSEGTENKKERDAKVK